MKSLRVHVLFITVLIVFLTSCEKSSTQPTLTNSPRSNTSPTSTVTLTIIPNDEPSPTSKKPIESASSTSTITPSKTPILLKTKTPTEVVTLNVNDATIEFKNLLSENGNCQLPCLWGIIPGSSTYNDAYEILKPLQSINRFFTHFGEDNITIDPCVVENGMTTCILIVVLTDPNDGIVNLISFEADAFEEIEEENAIDLIFNSSRFGKMMSKYSLSQIIDEFGTPTQILLSSLAEYPDPNRGEGYFKVLILYPNSGILAHYTTDMKIEGENVIGCMSNSHMDIHLVRPGNSDEFFNSLGITWQNALQTYLPIEEVTDFSKGDFIEMFLKSPDECILTPTNIWPIPEK